MYKRPTIDEELYYEMVKAAADKKQTVKDWLAEAIREKLERQGRKSNEIRRP
jgi:hypothetical protein